MNECQSRNNKMRKYIKKVFIMSLVLVFIIGISKDSINVYANTIKEYNSKNVINTINNMIESINLRDWDKFTSLFCREEQKYYYNYFSDDQITDGVKQIINMEVVHEYIVSNDDVKDEWLVEEYPDLLADTNKVYSAIVEINCEVDKENQFFFNGNNFFLIVLAVENNELKVVQFNRPNSDIVGKIIEKTRFDSEDENRAAEKGLSVLEAAECGYAINAEGEAISEGFEVISGNAETALESATTSAYTVDPPILSHYSTYSYPTKIKVKLNKNGGNEIVTVNFTTYMKHVLPNEWIPSWDSTAIKVGAYCVKMVGIYCAINPMSSTGGYNLTQKTQNYLPNSQTYASTNTAIDSIKNKGMANSSGKLFFPRYFAGNEGSKGTKGSGVLEQYGSQKLATNGYTYQQILNYYYSGSAYSAGDVNLFGYNIGY